MAAALFIAMLAMTALIVDGGNAWVQQRATQNATDSAANAGAGVLARNLYLQGKTDGDVKLAIDNAVQANGVDPANVESYYTTRAGVLLDPPDLVGDDPTNPPPAAAAGVQVGGTKTFGTFFARIIGFSDFSASTSATAVSGWRQLDSSSLLPVSPPVTVPICDNSGDLINTSLDYSDPDSPAFVISLCKSADGNVGWLDWDPADGGGASEVRDSIVTPNNPPIPLPSWQLVSQTGNMNMLDIETQLRVYDGQVVFVPLFDAQCGIDPGDPTSTTCTDPPHGANTWYHIPKVLAFRFCGPQPELDGPCGAVVGPDGVARDYNHGAYINGGPGDPSCGSGNGMTGCLVGKFVEYISSGTVDQGAGPGGSGFEVAAVQLIR
jgi:hypothetical protein